MRGHAYGAIPLEITRGTQVYLIAYSYCRGSVDFASYDEVYSDSFVILRCSYDFGVAILGFLPVSQDLLVFGCNDNVFEVVLDVHTIPADPL
jgi:hypothetical protein